MSLASLRTHTDAVVAKLVAAGLVVGDGTTPTDPHGWAATPGQSAFVGYVIVYGLGGAFDGTLGTPDDDATLGWQLTCVGASREQAEWVADTALAALVGQTVAVAGRVVMRIEADLSGAGVRRDDETQPALFLTTPRVRAASTPS